MGTTSRVSDSTDEPLSTASSMSPQTTLDMQVTSTTSSESSSTPKTTTASDSLSAATSETVSTEVTPGSSSAESTHDSYTTSTNKSTTDVSTNARITLSSEATSSSAIPTPDSNSSSAIPTSDVDNSSVIPTSDSDSSSMTSTGNMSPTSETLTDTPTKTETVTISDSSTVTQQPTQHIVTDESTDSPFEDSSSTSISSSSFSSSGDKSPSSSASTNRTTTDAFHAERLRLNGKVEELNDQVKGLTIAVGIIASILVIVITAFIVYKIVTYIRRRNKPAIPQPGDDFEDKPVKRDQKSYFRPQTTYDYDKNNSHYAVTFTNEPSGGSDDDLVTFNLPEPGHTNNNRKAGSDNTFSSPKKKAEAKFRDPLRNNEGLRGAEGRPGSVNSFEDINLT